MKQFLTLLLGCLLLATAHADTDGAQCPINAKNDIVNVMTNMYGRLQTDDLAGFKKLTAPDYYAFDAGLRFNAETLVAFVSQRHAQGFRFEWNVTEPDVHVNCDHAWLSYLNSGWVEAAGVKTPTEWLESAELEYLNQTWLIRFFHSTRKAKPS